MASAVYSEPPSSRLSISLEGTASSSPFPSPSSSFIPPPTPGAHEFAVKPVPPARNGKKTSTTNSTSHPPSQSQPLHPQVPSPPLLLPETDSGSGDLASELKMHHEPSSQPPSLKGVAQAHISNTNGLSQLPPASKEALPPVPLSPALISPMTPTPSSVQRKIIPKEYLEPPRTPGHAEQSHSSSTTPTIPISALPSEEDEKFASENTSPATATASSFPPSSSSLLSPSHAQDVDSSLSKIIIPDNLLDASTPGSGLSSPAFTPSSRPMSSADPSLFSNRPAPPSPAMSRRVSGAPSISSTRSRSSRPPSTSVSRTNSLRHSTQSTHSNPGGSARNSPVINSHRQSLGSQLNQSFAPLPSPQHLTFSLNVPQASASGSSSAVASSSAGVPASPTTPATAMLLPATPATAASTSSKRASAITYIKIRDFGFAPSDERHIGLGPEVPKPNRIGRMNRRLRGTRTLSTFSQGSVSSSDGDGEEEDEDDVDAEDWSIGGYGIGGGGGGGWDGFRIGLGRFNWHSGANAATVMESERQQQQQNQDFPSRMDLDRNFLDEDDMDDDDEYYDAAQDEGDEETLYPGLYRALYAFEPEGTAEMRLVEDQIVRVVGRGGGVGWAVVIDESEEGEGEEASSKADGGTSAPKHALVPESYLEPVRLDWEDEEEAAAVPAAAAAGGSIGEHDVATPVKNVPSITLA